MFRKSILSLLFYIITCVSLIAEPRPLKISDVQGIIAEMLHYHVENRSFSPMVVQRSFKIFIEQFDPGKNYLLYEEVSPYLHMSDKQALKVIMNVRNHDYRDYMQLMLVFQKAIKRNRDLRNSIMDEMSQQSYTVKLKESYSKEYVDYAYNKGELKERVVIDIDRRLFIDAREQGYSRLSSSQLIKALRLIERRDRRYENVYLFKNYKDKALPKEKRDNTFSTLILKSVAKSLDAHTAFFSPEEAISMRASLQKQFKGIGVVIREGLEGSYIGSLVPNGPAARSGKIEAGDVLIQINGKNVEDLPFEEVLEAMHATKGNKINLVLRRHSSARKSKIIHVKLKKEVIVMENDRLSYTTEPVANGIIGKVELSAFYDNGAGITSEKDLKEAIIAMKEQGDLKGLILDFRNNSGGFLTQAVKVSGVFIPRGIIVISKYANGEMQYNRDLDGKLFFQGPLVVLTSKASASAAEVVAQALQDYGTALVVGDERTYGKGSMQIQNITDERAEAFFKVTVGRYYTISGRSTQIDGVIADIHVPTKYAPFEIGERYLTYPLPRDELGYSFLDNEDTLKQYAKKDPRQMFSKYFPKKEMKWRKMLPTLKANSERRIARNKNYQEFLLEVERIKSKQTSGKKHKFGTEDLQMNEATAIVKDMIVLDKQGG